MSYKKGTDPRKRRWSRSETYWTLVLAQRRERHAQLTYELGEHHPATIAVGAQVAEAERRCSTGRFGKKG